jgi:hypothetical protein
MSPCFGCTPVSVLRDLPGQLGIGRRRVATLVQRGTLVRLDRYLVVGSCLVNRAAEDHRFAHRLKLDRLLLTYPECVASHESAALVRDLPLYGLPPYAIATRAWGAWRGGADGRVRIAPLPPHHVGEVDGLAATSLPRTVVDLARSVSMRGAVVVGDAALRRGVDRIALLQTLNEVATWADLGRARQVMDFLDSRSESALESLSRVIFHEYGVPPPEPQYEIDLGSRCYRVDFYWKDFNTIGEADGRVKYTGELDATRSPEQVVWEEKLREDALRDSGWKVVRWTYDQMLRQTDETVARILRRLQA